MDGWYASGRQSSSSWVIVRRVSFSMPLATVSRGTCSGRNGSALPATSRVACEGVAKTTSSAPASASSSESVAFTRCETGMPGR